MWYQNQGESPPSFSRKVINDSYFDGISSVYVDDLDGDHDLDMLVTASEWNNSILWYENSGGIEPVFHRHLVFSQALRVRGVGVADIDGDRRLDVLSASYSDNSIRWYENVPLVEVTLSSEVAGLYTNQPQVLV